MRRLRQLRPPDLEHVAVWRYEGTNDEDAVVRATDRTSLSDSDRQTFIARTQFALADGSQHIGFCSPGEDESLYALQPAIVTAEGLVWFWFAEPPSEQTLREQWRRLGVTRESVFPVHFRCTVPFEGNYLTGTINEEDLTGAA